MLVHRYAFHAYDAHLPFYLIPCFRHVAPRRDSGRSSDPQRERSELPRWHSVVFATTSLMVGRPRPYPTTSIQLSHNSTRKGGHGRKKKLANVAYTPTLK